MAVRAAFGIFYGSVGGNTWNTTADNQPFSIRQQFNNPGTLTDPYSLQPGGVSPFPFSYSPNNIRFILPAAIGGPSLDFRMPYVYQINFSVQRQVTSDLGSHRRLRQHSGPQVPFQSRHQLSRISSRSDDQQRQCTTSDSARPAFGDYTHRVDSQHLLSRLPVYGGEALCAQLLSQSLLHPWQGARLG